MEFSYKTMLWKGVKNLIIFGLPFLVTQFIDNFPAYANLTIGGILKMIVNWLQVKVDVMGKLGFKKQV